MQAIVLCKVPMGLGSPLVTGISGGRRAETRRSRKAQLRRGHTSKRLLHLRPHGMSLIAMSCQQLE